MQLRPLNCVHARALSQGGAFALKAGVAITLGLWTLEGFAAQANNTFEVRVRLQQAGVFPPPNPIPPIPTPPPPAPPAPSVPGGGSGNAGNGLCLNTTSADNFGARATVVCSTGALVDLSPGRSENPWIPMHGGAFRYVTQVFWNGDWIESIDDSPGTGTVTSWRRVNLLNREYLELTIGW